MFLYCRQKQKRKNQTAATAPLSRAPGLVSKALPESQGVPYGVIHIPPEFRERLSSVSEASEGQTLKAKAGESSVFLCLLGAAVKSPRACS